MDDRYYFLKFGKAIIFKISALPHYFFSHGTWAENIGKIADCSKNIVARLILMLCVTSLPSKL